MGCIGIKDMSGKQGPQSLCKGGSIARKADFGHEAQIPDAFPEPGAWCFENRKNRVQGRKRKIRSHEFRRGSDKDILLGGYSGPG